MQKDRDLLAYVLSEMGCIHPFLASRILALAESKYFMRKGKRLTRLRYVGGPGTFYIEGLKELVDNDECFRTREGDPSAGKRGCIEYICREPLIDEDAREVIGEAIEEARRLGEFELNRRLMENPVFKRLLERR